MEIQLTAPYLELADHQGDAQQADGAGRHEPADSSAPGSRSRRKSPSTRNSASPSKMARNCLKRLLGALEAVTDRDRVERKKAMVSISKPTQRVARRASEVEPHQPRQPQEGQGDGDGGLLPRRPRSAAGRPAPGTPSATGRARARWRPGAPPGASPPAPPAPPRSGAGRSTARPPELMVSPQLHRGGALHRLRRSPPRRPWSPGRRASSSRPRPGMRAACCRETPG